MRERKNPPKGLIGRIARGLGGLAFALSGALFLSVVIEWVGLTFFWSEQGASRSAAVLEKDLSYLGADAARRPRNPDSAAAIAVGLSSRLYQTVMANTGLETILRSLAGYSALLTNYLEAALNTMQTFLVRVAITVTALPIVLLFVVWGALEGAVRRDLRRFGGDIERGMVYHWLKHFAGALMFLPVVVYLAWPGAVNPAWVFLPFAFVLGINVMALSATFTKYV